MSDHKVGDHVLVKLSGGRIVEATIKAINGVSLQVSFGEETARVSHSPNALGVLRGRSPGDHIKLEGDLRLRLSDSIRWVNLRGNLRGSVI
jgi:hypothetical protein